LTRNRRNTRIRPIPAIPPKTLARTVVVGAVVALLLEDFAPEDDVDATEVEVVVPVGTMPRTPPPEPVAL